MEKIDHNSFNRSIMSNMAWRFFERGGVQIVNFIIQIILGRLLDVGDFGTIAIISSFVTLSSTLVNNGLGNALIQKKDSDAVDASTVFYIQLVLAFVLSVVLFFCAPLIASYYKNDKIADYLRVMVSLLVIQSLGSMQLVTLQKRMQFRKSFYANILGVIVQGTVGIVCALLGLGCWSLVFSQLAMQITVLIVLTCIVRWKPQKVFSLDRFKRLFSYSWKLTVGWLIGTLHQDIYSLLIGKVFSAEILGYYNRGQSLPSTLNRTVNESISSVMFPALSIVQDNKDDHKQYSRKMMAISSFVVFPVMAGLAAVARPFILITLTDKWAASIPMMQLFCISLSINAISTTNMQVFNSIGRSDVFMKMEVIKRSLSIVLLIILSRINIYAVIIGLVIMALFSLVYNSIFNKKLIGYSLKEQAQDILVPMIISIGMFVVTVQFDRLSIPLLVMLIIQIVVGVLFYVVASRLFNKRCFMTMLNMLKGLRRHGR